MLRGLRMSLGVCITMVIAFCIICPRLKGTRVAQSNWNTQHVPLLVCIPDTMDLQRAGSSPTTTSSW